MTVKKEEWMSSIVRGRFANAFSSFQNLREDLMHIEDLPFKYKKDNQLIYSIRKTIRKLQEKLEKYYDKRGDRERIYKYP